MLHIERVQPATRRWTGVAWTIVVILTLVITTTVVLLVTGNLLDPASNLY
jgi:hypothetical protein